MSAVQTTSDSPSSESVNQADSDLSILIAIDDSNAAVAAVESVLHVFAPMTPKPRLVLLHVLVRAIPPEMEYLDPSMVWDGAAIPTTVLMESHEQIRARAEESRVHFADWFARIVATAGVVWPTDRAVVEIADGGFTRAAIAEMVAYQARQHSAQIVVVGRARHGAFHDAIIKSTGERLVHYAKGLTVWVVNTPPAQVAAAPPPPAASQK